MLNMILKKYRMWMRAIALLSLLSGCSTRTAEGALQSQDHLALERVMLPVKFSNSDGSSYTVALDAIIVRPDDDQPHPLAVINHGYDPFNYKIRHIENFERKTIEFARRGWTAIAFSRRGYGHSDGVFSESLQGCSDRSVVNAGLLPVEDIEAVIRLMATQRYVDASKVLAIGHSGGGYAMIALAAQSPPGVVAAINIAGSVRETPDRQPCISAFLHFCNSEKSSCQSRKKCEGSDVMDVCRE
jgi:pimeloyl-ACP methyl ester carboxylesterase